MSGGVESVPSNVSWKQDTMVSSSQPHFIRSVSGGDSRSIALMASEDICDKCCTVGV